MIEIFPREHAANPEPFTGERLTSSLSGQTQIEHYHRYLFARTLCSGLDVLDVASGEGYGSAQLAQVARTVVGLEYAPDTVRLAALNFVRPNLIFLQGDARALPLPDNCVDAAVSFETIEHFDRQEDFVAEIRRVLRPGGCFIVSTPDREIYSPPGAPPNPFHVREMSRDEFTALLRQRFEHVALLSQRPMVGSALLADFATAADPIVFERKGQSRFECRVGLPNAPYIVAVASDRPIQPLPFSLFIERSDLDTDAALVGELRARLDNLNHAAEAARLSSVQAHQSAEAARATAEAARISAVEARTSAEAALTIARKQQERADGLAQELHDVRGSLRQFMRSYLPRLRRHIFK